MTRRKDGLWQESIAVTVNGRKKRVYFYGKTKAEVLRKIAAHNDRAAYGESFSAVSDEWWEEHEPTLSPTTVSSYKRGKARVDEYFGKTNISQITPLDVSRYMNSIIIRYKMAKRTAANHLIVVNQIFKYAVQNGYCESNPARDISVPKNLKREARKMPSREEIARIKDSIDCTFGLFAYFTLYTGLRKGECLALLWEDIDFTSKTIRVNKSLYFDHNRPKVKLPKTLNGIRTIPLPERLERVLTPSTGAIFNLHGNYLTDKQFKTLYGKYRAESGVTSTAHQLRHAYATMLYENDVPLKDAQRILGHAQSGTTLDVYTEIGRSREALINESLRHIDIS